MEQGRRSEFSEPAVVRWRVCAEPKGDAYLRLAEHAASESWWASVVMRDDTVYSERAKRMRAELMERGACAYRSSHWPGTGYPGTENGPFAEVIVFDAASAARVLRSTDHLYGWRDAAFPEDLSLYEPGGNLVLLSCAHERFAEVYAAPSDRSGGRWLADWKVSELPLDERPRLPEDVLTTLMRRRGGVA